MIICEDLLGSVHFDIVPAVDTFTIFHSDAIPSDITAQHPAETTSIAHCSLLRGRPPVKANELTASQKSKLMNFSRSPDKNHLSRSKVSISLRMGQLFHNFLSVLTVALSSDVKNDFLALLRGLFKDAREGGF